MSSLTYESRIAAQIAQFAKTVNMHDLPDIFHVWSNEHLAPGLKEVFNITSIYDLYVEAYIEAAPPGLPGRILSIGCGDGQIEIEVAKGLISRGFMDFKILCADLSPSLLENLTRAAAKHQLSGHLLPVTADLNNVAIPGTFDVIMANHSLHHIQGLEALFDYSFAHLTDRGIFATNDMIGRNGHQRWKETEAILQALWPILDPRQRYHYNLSRYDEKFVDHDCSTEGFEGIRAQDILPVALERLHPYKFFATGGFIDPLVDRGYGPGFSIKDERDMAVIRAFATLNDMMLDAGLIKPTMMMAYFTKQQREEIFYRNRRAINSVRTRDGDYPWSRFY